MRLLFYSRPSQIHWLQKILHHSDSDSGYQLCHRWSNGHSDKHWRYDHPECNLGKIRYVPSPGMNVYIYSCCIHLLAWMLHMLHAYVLDIY